MNNITIGFQYSFENKQKVVVETIVNWLRGEASKISYLVAEDNYMLVEYDDDEKYWIELVKQEPSYLVNLINLDVNKRDLFYNRLKGTHDFIQPNILFDSYNSILLGECYQDYSNFELYVKYKFITLLIENDKIDFFIGHISTENGLLYKQQEGKVQWILNNINIKYINNYIIDNPLGGDELNEIKSLKDFEDDELANNLKKLVNNRIFKGLIDPFENRINDIITIRNMVAHSRLIKTSEISDIKLALSEYEIGDQFYVNNDIIVLINSDGIDIEKLIKIILMDVVKPGILSIDKNEKKYTADEKIITYDEINGYFVVGIKDSEYTLCNLLDCEKESPHNYYKLLYDIVKSDIIILKDAVSNKFSNDAYKDIIYIETLVRGYIGIHTILGLEFLTETKNEKEKKYVYDFSGSQVNDDLFKYDFIDYTKYLTQPIGGDFKRIKNAINNASMNPADIFDSISTLSDMSDGINELVNGWKELYEIRTIIMHTSIVHYNDIISTKQLIENSAKKLETILNELLLNKFECMGQQFEILLTPNIKISGYYNDFSITINETKIYECNNINIFFRIVNLILNNERDNKLFCLKPKIIQKYTNKTEASTNKVDEELEINLNNMDNYVFLITKKEAELVKEITKLLEAISN